MTGEIGSYHIAAMTEVCRRMLGAECNQCRIIRRIIRLRTGAADCSDCYDVSARRWIEKRMRRRVPTGEHDECSQSTAAATDGAVYRVVDGGAVVAWRKVPTIAQHVRATEPSGEVNAVCDLRICCDDVLADPLGFPRFCRHAVYAAWVNSGWSS